MKKLFGILFLISIFALTGCSEKKAATSVPLAKIDRTKLIAIEKTTIDDYYETSGTVKAKTSSNIASKILARVDSVNIEEGDAVQKGQLLVLLDNDDIRANVHSAEAAYNEAVKNQKIAKENKNLAEITYERYKNIYEEKAITKQELDEVTTKKNIEVLNCKRSIETANRTKATLDEAKSILGYSRIYAPISGIVTSKNIDIGDMAAPGQILLTIKDIKNLQIVSEVDESYLNQVQKDSPVKIVGETEFEAVISDVISSVNPASRTFKIKINLENTDLKDGQYVKIFIPVGKRETVMIPQSAVVKKGQLEGVYSADSTFRLVKTGETRGDMIEILSGLEAGEEILGE